MRTCRVFAQTVTIGLVTFKVVDGLHYTTQSYLHTHGTRQQQTYTFHSIYVSTVPVHKCSVANQVQACDMHHSCVVCVHWQLSAC